MKHTLEVAHGERKEI